MQCPLCFSDEYKFAVKSLHRDFFRCHQCDLLFVAPEHYLAASDEKSRYQEHNNDISDPRYQQFVLPLAEAIQKLCAFGAKGLDFGAGTGPVLAHVMEQRGFQMHRYDPFFWPDGETLKTQYDFVVSSEVVEHFHAPAREFALLRSLLKPGGYLGVMTLLHIPEQDLSNWYYLRDPTHVVIYSEKTFQWIAQAFGFSAFEITLPRVAIARI